MTTSKKINEAVSNRTTAMLYGISSMIWMACLLLSYRSMIAGKEDVGQVVMCTFVACVCLGFMVHYIKHYVIGGRIKIGLRESFRIYCEGLGNEISQSKLRAPIFVGMAVLINIVMPISHFILDVMIKHKPMHPHDFVSAVFVAGIFSCIYALVASANNISKAKKKIDNDMKQEEKDERN